MSNSRLIHPPPRPPPQTPRIRTIWNFRLVSISSSQAVTLSKKVEVTNVFSPVTSFVWGERDETLFSDDLSEVYEKIVFWRKIFLCYQPEMQERNTSKNSLVIGNSNV